jgi:hypothetical protein
MHRDIEMMLGYKPCLWWSICWKFITPTLLAVREQLKTGYRSCIEYQHYSLRVSIWPLSMHLLFDFWTLPNVVFFVFHFMHDLTLNQLRQVISEKILEKAYDDWKIVLYVVLQKYSKWCNPITYLHKMYIKPHVHVSFK